MPCCGQETLMVFEQNVIETALATERRLTLCSKCAQSPRDVGRQQRMARSNREYAETLHFLERKPIALFVANALPEV